MRSPPSLSTPRSLRLCLCSAQPAATFELYKALPTTTTATATITAELYEITICNNSNSNYITYSYSYSKLESNIFSLRRSVKRSHQNSVLNIVLSVQINFMKHTNIVLENERAINTATTITKSLQWTTKAATPLLASTSTPTVTAAQRIQGQPGSEILSLSRGVKGTESGVERWGGVAWSQGTASSASFLFI